MKKIKKGIIYLCLGLLLFIALFPVLYVFFHSLKGEELIRAVYTTEVPLWNRIFPKPFYVNLDQYYRILFRTPIPLLFLECLTGSAAYCPLANIFSYPCSLWV